MINGEYKKVVFGTNCFSETFNTRLIMFRFNTKEEMLNSPDIIIGLVYLAPESGGDLKMWRVLSGEITNIENMLETCNGIPNAFVQNISGSFKSRGVINGDVSDFYSEMSPEKMPYNTIHFNTEDDKWRIAEFSSSFGPQWYILDTDSL